MIIYDCEIIKGIARKGEPRIDGIEYCDGWRDFDNMGISTICAYDYAESRYRVFLEDGNKFAAFQELVDSTDIIVGFNSIQFDNKLCAANNLVVRIDQSYDLLVAIWRGAGLGPVFNPATHGGFGLDAVAAANVGLQKSGHGARAPIDWQQGRYGSVIDYCLQDIKLTKTVLDEVIATGMLINPKNGETIAVDGPF